MCSTEGYAFQVLIIGFLVAKLDFSAVFMMNSFNEGRSLILFFPTEGLHFDWVLQTWVNFACLRLVLLGSSCLATFKCFKRLLLNLIEDSSENGFRIEAVNLLVEVSIFVEYRCGGEWAAAHIFHAMLRIAVAVGIVHLKAPFFLVFQHVHHLLQVSAETQCGEKCFTIWRMYGRWGMFYKQYVGYPMRVRLAY